jgi:predicted regulator of Ras-like GTPase activity (Roadblock/LC7/MglB family)
MSELDDALAMLERAVARLEAAPLPGADGAAAKAAAEREAEDRQLQSTAAEIVARVDAALAKIGQVLDGDG